MTSNQPLLLEEIKYNYVKFVILIDHKRSYRVWENNNLDLAVLPSGSVVMQEGVWSEDMSICIYLYVFFLTTGEKKSDTKSLKLVFKLLQHK